MHLAECSGAGALDLPAHGGLAHAKRLGDLPQRAPRPVHPHHTLRGLAGNRSGSTKHRPTTLRRVETGARPVPDETLLKFRDRAQYVKQELPAWRRRVDRLVEHHQEGDAIPFPTGFGTDPGNRGRPK